MVVVSEVWRDRRVGLRTAAAILLTLAAGAAAYQFVHARHAGVEVVHSPEDRDAVYRMNLERHDRQRAEMRAMQAEIAALSPRARAERILSGTGLDRATSNAISTPEGVFSFVEFAAGRYYCGPLEPERLQELGCDKAGFPE
jgi:hypothetical protein